LALGIAAFLSRSKARLTAFAIGEAGRRVALPYSQLIKVDVAPPAWSRSKNANIASLSAMTFLGTVVAACSASRIVMRSQGQGGRFNTGQNFFPKLKGAKKLAVLRKRKIYGSKPHYGVPVRYPIYDKLEEYDETLPWFTVLSEPKEPQPSIRDAPLLKRYPWAEPFKTPKLKQKMEANPKKGLEPLFGNFIYDIPPPLTRRQKYIERRGFPTYQYPPWINKPKYGTEWPKVWRKPLQKDKKNWGNRRVDEDVAAGGLGFYKDRRCGPSKDERPEELEAAVDDDGFDDMDAVLDALDEE